MKNKSTHATLLSLVGAYVLYIAYTLMERALSGADEMPMWAAIAASAVFVVGGIGVMIYAMKVWKEAKKEQDDARATQTDETNEIK